MPIQGCDIEGNSAQLRGRIRRTALILLGILVALVVLSVLFVMSRGPKGAQVGRLPAVSRMQAVGVERGRA